MKKALFIILWVFATIGMLSGSLYLFRIAYQKNNQKVQAATTDEVPLAPNYLDGEVKGIQTKIEVDDARVEIVRKFLDRHNAPLLPTDHFAKVFVELADKYDVDYRLLPAIAMQESNLCKKIPPGSFNCLGFGVHSRGTLEFESYEANFERAARELKKNYIDIGLTTPELIMTKYTPSSNGSWANSVNQWITEMEYDSREKGRELDENADLTEYVSDNSMQ